MADDIRKWVDKAKRDRAEDEKRAADKKPAPPSRPDAPTSTPPDDERIEVYRALHSGSVWGDLVMVIVVAAVVGGLAMIIGAPPNIAIPIVAGLALVLVVIRLATYRRKPTFAAFRRWRRELPFELLGWSRLVDAEHFGAKKSNDFDYWRPGSIAVTVDAAASRDATEAIDAVLVLFCKQANKRFYDFKAATISSPDPRKKWQQDGLSVAGSINSAVAYDIYWSLLRRLEVVARARGSITQVVITADYREQQVKGFEYHESPFGEGMG